MIPYFEYSARMNRKTHPRSRGMALPTLGSRNEGLRDDLILGMTCNDNTKSLKVTLICAEPQVVATEIFFLRFVFLAFSSS